MATGDQADIFARIRSLVPSSWIPAGAPIAEALFQGPAWALSTIYSQIAYAKLQARIKTATDGYLDLISADFFGQSLPRLTNEQDGAFRARILANLFIKGPTRGSMSAVIEAITGRKPDIFEPSNATDSLGLDGAFFWDTGAGKWGDPLPYQSFVTAYRPSGENTSLAELDSWRMSWDSFGAWSDIQSAQITDAAIFAAVESTRALGTTVWLRIADSPVTP